MTAINALYSYQSYINDGLLLEIGGRDTKHFDCKWFSDFTNENEMIFMHCTTALIVQNVIDIELGLNYHLYLYTYSVINLMLTGQDIDKQKGMNFEVELKIINPIYSFLYYKFYGKQNKLCIDSLSIYIKQLFNSYFKKSKIKINWQQLNTAKRKVTGYGRMNTFSIKIVSFCLPFIMYYQIEWIKWHLLIKAFPKLKTITISGLKLSHSQFEDMLFQIKNLSMDNDSNQQQYALKKLVLTDTRQHQLSFDIAQDKYNERFKQLKWELTNPKYQIFEIRRMRN